MNEILPVWGFNTQRRMKALKYINQEQGESTPILGESKNFKGIIRKGNALKVLGYFPGLNIVTGIAIITFCSYNKNHILKNFPEITKKYRYRGMATIAGGPLLVVFDLVTIAVDEIFTIRPALKRYHSVANGSYS